MELRRSKCQDPGFFHSKNIKDRTICYLNSSFERRRSSSKNNLNFCVVSFPQMKKLIKGKRIGLTLKYSHELFFCKCGVPFIPDGRIKSKKSI